MAQDYQQLADFLEQKGYKVAVAHSAQEAVQMSRSLKPIAVVMDLRGLGAESWRIFQDLRGNDDTAQLAILALTTGQDEKTVSSLGANVALRKPVEPALLLRALEDQVVRLAGETVPDTRCG